MSPCDSTFKIGNNLQTWAKIKIEKNLMMFTDKKLEMVQLHVAELPQLMTPRSTLEMLLYYRPEICIFQNSADTILSDFPT